jgi:hypothetical protein
MSAKLGLAKHKYWKTRYIHWDRERSWGTSVVSAVNKLYFYVVHLIREFAHPNQFNLWYNFKRDSCTSSCNGSTYLLSQRKRWEYHKDVNGLFIVLNFAHSNRTLPRQRRQLRVVNVSHCCHAVDSSRTYEIAVNKTAVDDWPPTGIIWD